MNRRTIATMGAGLALVSCVDRISAPNTDVGLTVWANVVPSTVHMRDSTMPIHFQVYVGNRSSEEIRELIIDWVEKNKTVPATPNNNWRIVP